MNKIWIGNGQLVLPDKIVPGGSVLLEGKKIAAVNVPCPPDARRVDVDGSYIMAGFVDIHVHGGGDSDFMDEDASAFPTIAKAHCAHGTTALCPTTMTCADSLLEKTIDLFLEADKEPENGAELLDCIWRAPISPLPPRAHSPLGSSVSLSGRIWSGYCGGRREASCAGTPRRSCRIWSCLPRSWRKTGF